MEEQIGPNSIKKKKKILKANCTESSPRIVCVGAGGMRPTRAVIRVEVRGNGRLMSVSAEDRV